MDNVEILYNGVYEPLLIRNQNIGLIISVSNPLEFKYSRSWKSYTIDIAKTGHNNKILSNLFNINYNKTLIFDARVKIDNKYIIQGKLLINMLFGDAKGQFVAQAGEVWAALGDSNLRDDFDWSAYDVDFSLDASYTIADFLSDWRSSGIKPVRFDCIYRGDGVHYATGQFRNIDICELIPSISTKTIIDKIFTGYTVTQNILTSTAYNRLYELIERKNTRNSKSWKKDAVSRLDNTFESNTLVTGTKWPSVNHKGHEIYVGNPNTNLFDTITTGGDNIDTNIRYNISELGAYQTDGRFEFRLSMTINKPGTPTTYWIFNREYTINVRHYSSSGVLQKTLYSETITPPNFDGEDPSNNDDIDVSFDAKTLEYNEGYIDVEIYYSHEVSTTDPTGIVTYPADADFPNGNFTIRRRNNSYFVVNPWEWYGLGATISGEELIPDMSVSKFIETFLKQFNCEMHIQPELKTVAIYNRYITPENFYDLTTNVIAGTIRAELRPEKTNFEVKYKEDSNDEYAKEVVKLTDTFSEIERDDGSIDVGYDANTTSVMEFPYSFTFMRNYAPNVPRMTKKYIDDLTTEIPWTMTFNNRRLFYNGNLSVTATNVTIHYNDGDGDSQALTSIPQWRNYYGSEVDLSMNVDTVGLYDKYWGTILNTINDNEVVVCEMILDKNFITNCYYFIEDSGNVKYNYKLDIPGFRGVYQILELRKKQGDIYEVRLLKTENYA